jgi:hypothetical protein
VMPVLLIWAIVFVSYAVNKTPPRQEEHNMTSWGIRTGGRLYGYNEMVCYWFEDKWGARVMNVLLNVGFPRSLALVLNEGVEGKAIAILRKMGIAQQKPEPSFLDKTVKWVGEKVPLDD